jgi:hypothetical protein
MDQSPAIVANKKGGKEIIQRQNYRFFKIFKMGRQLGACKEKERRNKVVRGFSKLEQSIPQGQLPSP